MIIIYNGKTLKCKRNIIKVLKYFKYFHNYCFPSREKYWGLVFEFNNRHFSAFPPENVFTNGMLFWIQEIDILNYRNSWLSKDHSMLVQFVRLDSALLKNWHLFANATRVKTRFFWFLSYFNLQILKFEVLKPINR